MTDYSVRLPLECVRASGGTEERKMAFRAASKYLVLGSIVPILLGLAFSNGLYLVLTPVLLWAALFCFVLSLAPARARSNYARTNGMHDDSSSSSFGVSSDDYNDYLSLGENIGRDVYPEYYPQSKTD